MDSNESYLTQQQQVDISAFVASAISAVILIVFVVWGVRQVVRGVRGEPVEQIPFEPHIG